MEFVYFYFNNFLTFAGNWWFFLLPFFLYPPMKSMWIYDLYARHFVNEKYTILSIKVPKELETGPSLMENVIHGIWNIFGETKHFMHTYCQGVFDDYISLEIVGVGGKIYYGIWVRAEKAGMIKTHLYANYPDCEIEELDYSNDYMHYIPDNIPNEEWDMWGAKFTLAKPDIYPLNTYPKFEDEFSKGMSDPIASYLEMVGSTVPGEFCCFQLLIEPVRAVDTWREEFDQEIEKILDRGNYKKPYSIKDDLIDHFGTLPMDTINAVFKYPEYVPSEDEKEQMQKAALMFRLSPGEQETIKEIERSLEKKTFKSQYSFVYVAKKNVIDYGKYVGGLFGATNQLSSEELNGFEPYYPYMTSSKYFLEKNRLNFIKRRLIRITKNRQFQGADYYFNTEEIATLWHFPYIWVKTPETPWVEAKKATPPLNLPTSKENI
ncbi:MAG: hypothetical protein GF335_02480 [Candidatus Moranbacteria bacterium]|nr:hypothetical protein [Candidatus Moranbacteria bacterium]